MTSYRCQSVDSSNVHEDGWYQRCESAAVKRVRTEDGDIVNLCERHDLPKPTVMIVHTKPKRTIHIYTGIVRSFDLYTNQLLLFHMRQS